MKENPIENLLAELLTSQTEMLAALVDVVGIWAAHDLCCRNNLNPVLQRKAIRDIRNLCSMDGEEGGEDDDLAGYGLFKPASAPLTPEKKQGDC